MTFSYNVCGKPRLADEWLSRPIEFNLAHSAGVGLCAVAIGHRVGVDLEQIRPNPSCMEIAQRFFAPAEVAALSRLTGDDLIRAFYRCWTRKEAYLKATGLGLSLPLASFVVPVWDRTKMLLFSGTRISGNNRNGCYGI